MLNLIEGILGLLIVVTGLAVIARKIGTPDPILLVAGGLLLSLVPGLPHFRLDPELVFFFFLPPLLYPAALFTSWRDFQFNLRPITLLALGLVLFTTVAIGLIAHRFLGLPLAAGFTLGAIISPPDAIAATAIAQRLRIPRRIVTILEGESLVNDATALVAYRFAVAAVVAGGSFSLTVAAGRFVLVAAGGIMVGLVAGWITAWIQARLDDPPIQTALSLLIPFAAYIPAERLGVSGVLAVVTTGLYHGWRSPEVLSGRMRLQAGPVWEMVEFLLNGFIFVLIGLQLPEVLSGLSESSWQTLLGYGLVVSLAVIVIRFLWVFPATYLPRLLSSRLRARDPSPPWQHVTLLGWTGMRGVVSLAAALALPLSTAAGAPFPGRDLILFLTFAVILATLVVQGLTLPWLIRWLDLKDDGADEKEERAARFKANEAALARLHEIASVPARTTGDGLQRLMDEYQDRLRQVETCEPGDGPGRLFSSEYEAFASEALEVERKTILQLRNERVINDEVLRRIQRDIDLAEARLRGAGKG